MPRRANVRRSGPRCPRCSAVFGKEADVVNHMNQPWAKCATWTTDLEVFTNARSKSPLSHRNTDMLSSGIGVDMMESPDVEGAEMEIDSVSDFSESDATFKTTPAHYVETYHGAGATYGTGKTFMDQFDSDEHASRRKTNLYYPFCSKVEWELASWLLRSNLSLRAIDNFLSLKLVSSHMLSTEKTKLNDTLNRFKDFHFHSLRGRIYAAALKCSLKGLSGNVNYGQRLIQLNSLSVSTIAMVSTVYIRYLGVLCLPITCSTAHFESSILRRN